MINHIQGFIEKAKENPKEAGNAAVIAFGIIFLLFSKVYKPMVAEQVKTQAKIKSIQAETQKILSANKDIASIEEEIAKLEKSMPRLDGLFFSVDQKRDAVEKVFEILARFDIRPKTHQQSKLEEKSYQGFSYFEQTISVDVTADFRRLSSLLYELENYEKLLNVRMFNLQPANEKGYFSILPMIINLYYHD